MKHLKKFESYSLYQEDPVSIAERIASNSKEFDEIKNKLLAGDILNIEKYVNKWKRIVTYKAVLTDGRTIGTSFYYLWDFGDSGQYDGKEGYFLSVSDKTFDNIRNEQLPLFNKFRKSGFSSGINYFFDSFNDKHDNPILIDKKSYNFINSLLEDLYLKKKKMNESWFNNPFKKKDSEYKSKYVQVYGDISDDKLKMLKAIDMCRDKGIDLIEASGEITDSADIWVHKGDEYLAIKPDYRKGNVKIYDMSSYKTISTFEIDEPEIMSDKICNSIN